MPQETTGEPKILLDCDVIIHFLKGEKILELPQIFPGRFILLDKVYKELLKRNSNVLAIGVFLAQTGIPVLAMPSDNVIAKEYFSLKKIMDDGEAACLSVAKHCKEYVASSNITQIEKYCRDNDIVFYTTMDLLLEAEQKGIMTEPECDVFIGKVKSKSSKLPCNTIKEYKTMKGID